MRTLRASERRGIVLPTFGTFHHGVVGGGFRGGGHDIQMTSHPSFVFGDDLLKRVGFVPLIDIEVIFFFLEC